MSLTKEQRFSIISSLIFLIGFTGLLLIFGFSVPFPPPEEEGILINFGNTETGSGRVEPKQSEEVAQQESVPEQTSTPEPTTTSDAKEEVITQDFDKTAVIEEKKKKKKEEIEQKKREEELERKRQEEIEKQRKIEEERKRKEEQQKAINDRAKGAFGKNPKGDNTGEGDDKAGGNKGKPDGDINSQNRDGGGGNGISFSLTGRSSKSLPKPDYKSQSEGKVVVEVTVDQNGNVVSARPGVKGTTTTNKLLHDSAREAALKAKFDVKKDAPALQKGTITYHFMLQ